MFDVQKLWEELVMRMDIVDLLNTCGRSFVGFAWPMLIQSCVLIVIMLAVDLAIRKRVRAVVRYWLWMLVMVKLVLPTSLTLPTGVGYWVKVEEPKVLMPVQETRRASSTAKQGEELEVPQQEIAAVSPIESTPEIVKNEEKTIVDEKLTEERSVVDWQGVVFVGWLIVAAGMALLVGQRYLFVRGLIRQATLAEGKIAEIFEECSKLMQISRKPVMKMSPTMVSPAACGLVRPVVIMPEFLPAKLSEKEMRAVLLHELAHIQRGDLWVNCVQTLLQVAYFYNPLLWLANGVIRRIREQAVDETVLVTLSDEAEQYPETLLNVAKLSLARPALSLRMVGVVESKSALAERIKHMINRPFPKSAKIGGLGLTGIVIIGALLLPMARGERKTVEATQAINVDRDLSLSTQQGETNESPVLRYLAWQVKGWNENQRTPQPKIIWYPDGRRVDKPEDLERIRVASDTKYWGKNDDVLMFWASHPMFDLKTAPSFIVEDMKGNRFPVKNSASSASHRSDEDLGWVMGAIGFEKPLPQGKINLRLQYSMGEWKYLEKIKVQPRHVTFTKFYPYDVALGPIGQNTENQAFITIIFGKNKVKDTQLDFIAITKDGRQIDTYMIQGAEYQTFAYDVPLSEVAEFQLRVRPIRTFVFKDIVLLDEKGKSLTTDEKKMVGTANPTATFSNGVTVELAGVSYHPSKEKEWWRADGSKLEQALYDSMSGHTSPGEKHKAREIVLKKVEPSAAKGTTYVWHCLGYSLVSGEALDETGQSIKEFEPIAISIPKEKNKVNVEYGMAAGEWKTYADYSGGGGLSLVTEIGGITFAEPNETDEYLVINVSLDINKMDTRIIAVDKDGSTHTATRHSSGSAGKSQLSTYKFQNLHKAQIKEYQFQARPYEWIEFKNVSLEPGVKTNVEIVGDKVEKKMVGTAQPTADKKENKDLYQLPSLKYLACQEDDLRDPPDYWKPNGGLVTDEQVIKMLREKLSPVGFRSEHIPDLKVLYFWFTHPLFDSESIGTVELFDKQGKSLSELNREYGNHFAAPWLQEPGWIRYTLAGVKSTFSEVMDIRFRYSLGPWEAIETIAADYRGGMSLGQNETLGSIGQNKEGKAFITLTRDLTKNPDTQFSFVAISQDGQVVVRKGGSTTGVETRILETFEFDAPLSKIKEFRLRKRPIRMWMIRDISLKPEVKKNRGISGDKDQKKMVATAYPTVLKLDQKSIDTKRTLTINEFEFGREISIDLAIAGEKTAEMNVESIEFSKVNDQIEALLKIGSISWPKMYWQIQLEILDDHNNVLSDTTETFENSGDIPGTPLMESKTLIIKLRKVKGIENAQGFRLQAWAVKREEKKMVGEARPTVEKNDNEIKVYPVNRRVSEFPEKEDFSTPESVYSAINRISAKGDISGWERASVKELAEKLAVEKKRGKMDVPAEWAKVLLNAEILEVCVWKNEAVVMAKLLQEFSTQEIRRPIDVRHLRLENNRWLNVGNDRVDTVAEGELMFKRRVSELAKKTVGEARPTGTSALKTAIVYPGKGMDVIELGDSKEKIKKVFGPAGQEVANEDGSIWMEYRKQYGLDFFIDSRTQKISEIRLNQGFTGKIENGVQIGDPLEKVLQASGGALKTVNVTKDDERLYKYGDDRVLYHVTEGAPECYKFIDGQKGMLYWLGKDKKLTQAVVIAPKSKEALVQPAVEAAEKWLKLVDEEQYGESWEMSAELFRKVLAKEKWVEMLAPIRKPLGKVISRKMISKEYTKTLPGAPDGEYVVIQFQTSFENKKEAVETVTPMKEKDGSWRVSGYYIK
jgi:beta-lactamase regulating signal transducer with metallopeptidase domain